MIIQGMDTTGPPAPVSPASRAVMAPMQKKPLPLCQNALPLPGLGGRRALGGWFGCGGFFGWRLLGGGCGRFAELCAQGVDARVERGNVLGRRHTELAHGLGDPFFENRLQLVPLAGSARANVGRHVADFLGCFGNTLFGNRLRLALDRQAFLHQGVEYLGAFFLGFGKGAQASQPDLVG